MLSEVEMTRRELHTPMRRSGRKHKSPLQTMKPCSKRTQGNPFGPERSEDIRESSQRRPHSTGRASERAREHATQVQAEGEHPSTA